MSEQRETEPAIRCVGLRKRYGNLQALAGVDLELRRGECLGLLGPNGAGKTTTVEILEGLRTPDAGDISILGLRWGRGEDHALRQRIGVQLQETQLAERLTVEETIRLFRSFYERGRTVEAVIALLDLQPKRRARVGTLSGGQRQRLALACALVSDPDLLFLDEPTTGLDPQARLRIWEVVEEFRSRGGSVLLTTHAMEEAARLCDRVAIIDQGKVIALGSPDELIRSLEAEQILVLTPAGTLPDGLLEALPGVSGVTCKNGSYHLSVRRIGETLPALLSALEQAGVSLEAMTTHQATLEDVFVRLTGRGLRDD